MATNGNIWREQAKQNGMDALASRGALMYDPMIIRKQGEEE
jgi:hypothetical protein